MHPVKHRQRNHHGILFLNFYFVFPISIMVTPSYVIFRFLNPLPSKGGYQVMDNITLLVILPTRPLHTKALKMLKSAIFYLMYVCHLSHPPFTLHGSTKRKNTHCCLICFSYQMYERLKSESYSITRKLQKQNYKLDFVILLPSHIYA